MFKKILVGVMSLTLLATSAYATVTVTSVKHTTWGNKRVTMGTLTISGTQSSSSGYALTPAAVGLNVVESIFIMPNSTSGYEYNWKYTKGYIVPFRTGWLDNEQAVTSTAADSFICARVVTMATDADTTILFVCPQAGPISTFVSPGCSGTTEATQNDQQFTNAGATLYGHMSDTTAAGLKLLDAVRAGGDTVFFDYNAAKEDRLSYSGTFLGNMGDLYVPWYDGKMIKVRYQTGAQQYAAGVGAAIGYMMYCKNGAAKDKFVWKKTTGASYPQGACTNGFYASHPNAPSGITATLYFIAIGN